MFQALRIRDFRLLWSGSVVSMLGSWLLILAIPAHVFEVTGSLRATGLTLAAEYLPALVLGPVAGVCADRWDRRRLMILTGLLRAGAVTVMLTGLAPGRYWILYAALAIENAGGALYVPALQARTPAIVGTGTDLSSANSLNALASGTMQVVGGPLGGVLLTVVGVRWLICADAISYLVAAGANALTTPARRESARGRLDGRAVLRDLADGIRALRADATARRLLPVTVVFLAANASLSALLIPFGIERLGGTEHLGILLAALGAGVLAGAPVLRVLLSRTAVRTMLTATLALTAASYFLLFTSSSLARALPAAAAVGMLGTMSAVIPLTAVQRAIPDAVLGRVIATFVTGEAAATLAGAVAGPFIAQAAGLTGLAAAASLATIVAAALTWLTIRTSVPRPPAGQMSSDCREVVADASQNGLQASPAIAGSDAASSNDTASGDASLISCPAASQKDAGSRQSGRGCRSALGTGAAGCVSGTFSGRAERPGGGQLPG
jgi:predicted MFS family arabinose efflux permease